MLVVFTDKRIPLYSSGTVYTYQADLKQAQQSSAFGAPLPDLRWYANSTTQYRFGFNGQEQDDEISGDGNTNTAEFWEYDARLGRRWNRDCVVKDHESPYAAFANNPICFIDPDGSDTITFNRNSWSGPPDPTGKPIGGVDNNINIKVAPGEDVFYYNTTHTHTDKEGKKTITNTSTRFYPLNPVSSSGLTYTWSIFNWLGMPDNDATTLAKFAPQKLVEYLIAKDSRYGYLPERQASIEFDEQFKTVVEIGITIFSAGVMIRGALAMEVGAGEATLTYTRQQAFKKFGEHHKKLGLPHTEAGFQEYLKMAGEAYKNPGLKHTFPQGGMYAGETWYFRNGNILRLDAQAGKFIQIDPVYSVQSDPPFSVESDPLFSAQTDPLF